MSGKKGLARNILREIQREELGGLQVQFIRTALPPGAEDLERFASPGLGQKNRSQHPVCGEALGIDRDRASKRRFGFRQFSSFPHEHSVVMQRFGPLRPLLQRGLQLGGSGRKVALQTANLVQPGMRLREFRFLLQGKAKQAAGLLQAVAPAHQQQRKLVACAGIRGIDAEEASQRGFRFRGPAELLQNQRIVVQRPGVVRTLPERKFQLGRGGGELALSVIDIGQHDTRLGKLGLALQRGAQQPFGARELPARIEQVAEIVVRKRVLGIERERRFVGLERAPSVADGLERYAEIEVRLRVSGGSPHRLAILLARLLRIARAFRADALGYHQVGGLPCGSFRSGTARRATAQPVQSIRQPTKQPLQHAQPATASPASRAGAYFSADFRSFPISAGFFVTLMPHSSMTASFSCAVPLPPEMMAPAWPMRFPGGAVTPAMKPTTGFFMLAFTQRAAFSSSEPPISPTMITASVSGSSLNIFSTSVCFRPFTGSPPMPTHED